MIVKNRYSSFAALLFFAVLTPLALAQTFTTLANFDGSNGEFPYYGALIQGPDGNLYGTTWGGGANGYGTVFEVSPSGTLTTLYSFCAGQFGCPNGSKPESGLALGTDGVFYGTTAFGGDYFYCSGGCGTVFKIPASRETLFNFDYAEGAQLQSGLVQATDGNLYGTTYEGGTGGYGTVFKMTPTGTWSPLHNFTLSDGANPQGTLVQGTDGSLYGTTVFGGTNGYGAVFKVASGMFTTLYSFVGVDGTYPEAGVIQGADGNFYGTTEQGGEGGCEGGCGTVFKITAEGALMTLHSFSSQTDGYIVNGGLIQATDGNFYGTTGAGGTNQAGTIFKITPEGTVTTLHTFDSTDGAGPQGALTQATNGIFYGMTTSGGTNGVGTIFSLDVGLEPFITTLPNFGKAGTMVRILGTDFTGATGVTFGGVAANFTVSSPSLIKATVPTGATTGSVQVTTPSGTLTSNVVFRVR
jgi:uncharacterized repeat protein (TIGR03803 family)